MNNVPFALVLITLLSGCTSIPTGNIEAFGFAAESVTDKIDEVIRDYNQANANDKLVIMAQSNKKLVKSDLDPIKKVIIRDSDKKAFALYKANSALGGYAKSLTELSNAGSYEELALAGVNLSKSLQGMNQQYKTLNDTEQDIISNQNSGTISRVITELSSYYVSNKRAKALKEVIVAADPAIQEIGKTIREQLLVGTIEGRLYAMKGNELAGYFGDYNAKVEKMSFSQKKKALDNIYERYIVMESTTATVVQAEKAILSIMKAHSALASELKDDRFSSKTITKALKEIKAVHNNFDDLEELMTNCTTEVIADDEKGIICKADNNAS